MNNAIRLLSILSKSYQSYSQYLITSHLWQMFDRLLSIKTDIETQTGPRGAQLQCNQQKKKILYCQAQPSPSSTGLSQLYIQFSTTPTTSTRKSIKTASNQIHCFLTLIISVQISPKLFSEEKNLTQIFLAKICFDVFPPRNLF